MNTGRPTATAKGGYAPKTSSKAERGVQKRRPVKKMYCTKCKRLVKGQMQSQGVGKRIICPLCGLHLWVWNRTSWACVKGEVFTSA
jgi:hypothetical protein